MGHPLKTFEKEPAYLDFLSLLPDPSLNKEEGMDST